MLASRTPPANAISPVVARLQKGLALRSNSLLVTVFGDAFAPRRQSISLSSLIGLLRLFAVAPRAVRTSCARLAIGEWRSPSSIGGKSYYRLSETGMLRVALADRRIYEFRLPGWDGTWTLVMPDRRIRSSVLAGLDHDLRWQGFGKLARNVFAHPRADLEALQEILFTWQASSRTAVLTGSHNTGFPFEALTAIMQQTFDLAQVDAAWKQFIARFSAMDRQAIMTPTESFYVRTLLIHEYRRVLLRDPNLPSALLPEGWSGLLARSLCEELYRKLIPLSERFLHDCVETEDGELQPTPKAILGRLGRHPAGT